MPFGHPRMTRRAVAAAGLGLSGIGALALTPMAPVAARLSPHALPSRQATPGASAGSDPAASILDLAREALDAHDLKAVILRVEIDGQELVTTALGESMTGVPATIDMHFRNGAVAISYMATLLLQLVDDGVVALDDPIATWLPELPEADQVTLRMLANMTAGYPDYVPNAGFEVAVYADPFRQWTAEELIAIGLSTPRRFAPGANWDYSHTNYVILGQALEAIAGRPLDTLMNERIFAPLGLTNTRGWSTPEIPEPVLHAFSSERHEALGIPAGVPFYEETTFWSPSWTLAPGAVQTTDIADMAASAIAIGEGTLLSSESHRAQIAPDLLGFGAPLEGCPACHTLDEAYSYGLGVVLSGTWVLQNPLLAGYGSVMAYLPGRKIAVAVVTTFDESAFDEVGNNRSARASWEIFARIASMLAPEQAPAATRS